jgi:heavy metal efflux system protein
MMTLLAKLLRASVEHRVLVVLLTLAMGALGAYDFTRLPIDAVPDITNVQVQINTSVSALAPPEIERRITFPVESAMGGLPRVTQVRSLSRYGLSQVTVVFEDGTDVYWARQLVSERLAVAREVLPEDAEPALGPIATGLGEIYQWTVEAAPDARKPDGSPYSPSDLRALQDFTIAPRLRNVRGVTDVNSIGGFERLFQVAPDPARLRAYDLSFRDVTEALRRNNGAVGGGYVERNGEQVLIRSGALVTGEDDLEQIVVSRAEGVSVRLRDVADVTEGVELRTGAATEGGRETVLGTALMLVGENSRDVANRVRAELRQIEKSLPEGVVVRTVYDRTYLVDATLLTVAKSLIEGALLVVVVLFLLLGNLRASLVAALSIPFAMLFAVTGMVHTQTSGNLMSLGAIDFGLVVDGSVIIVENCVRRFGEARRELGRTLTVRERVDLAFEASREVRRATLFGEVIITVVYLPILTLTGIEGKMFKPMAVTVVLALVGATILSMTFIPALVALALSGDTRHTESRLFGLAQRLYGRVLEGALGARGAVLAGAATLVFLAGGTATLLGSEFAPKLSEGALALQPARIPSIALTTSVELEMQVERTLLEKFPDEIALVFARTGTAEIATDPMGPNVSDVTIMLHPPSGWTRASTQEELAEAIETELRHLPGQSFEFSQPIELRFNELLSGVRSDVAIKVFGDDLTVMRRRAEEIARVLAEVPGARDVKVEQVAGLPVLDVAIDRAALTRYGLSVDDVNQVVEAAVGGVEAGKVYDGDRRFGLVVRLPDSVRRDLEALKSLPIPLPRNAHTATGIGFVPLSVVAKIALVEGPNQISREGGKRRVVVQANVRGRDLGSFVEEAERRLDQPLARDEGTWLGWGGQYENLLAARRRLFVVVPLALALVFGLLYATFRRALHAAIIFTGVPLALTGGVFALALRGLPFSISAAVGFIALSGVAVLNGLVMLSVIDSEHQRTGDVLEAVRAGSKNRLRPVLMTALVAALGFVPMALATGTGSEVQRPLATVVIGGVLSSTLLTLVVLPLLFAATHADRRQES